MRYKQIIDNKTFYPDLTKPHYTKCCDCGLVHKLTFHIGIEALRINKRKIKDADNKENKTVGTGKKTRKNKLPERKSSRR